MSAKLAGGCGSRFSAVFLFSLSGQSLGSQPFQIFARRDLILLVFGQRAVRWTEYVVDVIFAFAHDVPFSKASRRRVS
jgi:hypothetical protein